ncbi:DUF6944 family repetitive protein [Sporosarcina koreensis]|uniref:DUF6944 family repetitive protein n=1 Tax=Sporosarcina koreensis TaxID=334735 RepID=A0ABW0TXJ0_9BACL
MDTQQRKDKEKMDSQKTEELKLKIEKQIAGAVWIQTFGVLLEVILLEKLDALSKENIEGETEALIGAWIQLTGLITESIGATQQAFEPSLVLEGQQVAVVGNLLQSIGSALKAVGGEKVFLNDLLNRVSDFVE